MGTDGLNAGERVGVILGSFGSSPNTNWEIHDDGQMRVFWNNGERNIFGETDLRDDQWHHLAFVRDVGGGSFKFYVDGVEETMTANSSSASNINFTSPHRIGQDNRSSNPIAFHGAMDELSIHDRALTPAEIAVRATAFDQRGEGFNRVNAGERDG